MSIMAWGILGCLIALVVITAALVRDYERLHARVVQLERRLPADEAEASTGRHAR